MSIIGLEDEGEKAVGMKAQRNATQSLYSKGILQPTGCFAKLNKDGALCLLKNILF